MTPQLYIATNGLGVWTSDDLGESLVRMSSRAGMYSGYHIWAFANDPSDANVLLAGTNGGLYRLDRRQKKWSHIPSPMDKRFKITAIAFSPHNPGVIFAGTQFAALYRSQDHGRTWRHIDLDLPEICPGNEAQARVTQILLDPNDAKLGWFGVELDHVWRTTNGGLTWNKMTKGLESGDIHGLAVINSGRRRVFAATDKGLHISDDDGASWRIEALDSPSNYTRAIVPRAGSGDLFLTNGDGPPGSWGRLYRSRDRGEHWERATLPDPVESSMWSVATHPADPALMFASACLGQIYRSTDGGETWTALKRRLGEIRHVMWLPA